MRLLSSLIVAMAVLVVAGCGGSNSSVDKAVAEAKSAAATSAAPPTATVTIERTATAPDAGCATVSQPDPHPERTHQTASTTLLSPKKQWTVILDTNCGLISIDLAVRVSPKTTAAFAGLVSGGFFNDLTFHRVSTGPDGQPFVIQGGDPLGTGMGGPGFQVVEPPPSNADYSRGVVAMAKTATDPSGASGSQFFIVTGADAGLPPQYALLGHLSAGQATVARIAAQPTQGNEMPVSPVVIRTATLRSH